MADHQGSSGEGSPAADKPQSSSAKPPEETGQTKADAPQAAGGGPAPAANKDPASGPTPTSSALEERVAELRDMGAAVGKLAGDADAFAEAVKAYRAQDAGVFQAALSRVGLFQDCVLICRWLCYKHCATLCRRFCRLDQEPGGELNVDELRAFAGVTARITADEGLLRRFLDVFDREDEGAFEELIKQFEWGRYCYQICQLFCSHRCRGVCELLCPPPPMITHVGNIPVAQINAQGLGAGHSNPVGYTPDDNKPGGVGDHPFGGWVNIRGVFSISNPVKYKVEYTTNPAGTWNPIQAAIGDAYYPGIFPLVDYERGYDGTGWYSVPVPPPPPPGGSIDTNGMGLYSMGHTYLADWWTPVPATPDGLYYLRLTVHNGVSEVQSPIVAVLLDNTNPTKPDIGLDLQLPDGSRKPLGCCEKVEHGDGNLIVITLKASDLNFSQISVALQGGCGASYPIVATDGTALSKTYNGNLADTGYPAPTEFLWDPWAAKVDPCCYLIYVRIWDRAIVNNYWSGGHGNENWHSITIA